MCEHSHQNHVNLSKTHKVMNFLRKDVVVHDLVQSLGIITISNTRTSFLKKFLTL
jgi:hypothetical protein